MSGGHLGLPYPQIRSYAQGLGKYEDFFIVIKIGVNNVKNSVDYCKSDINVIYLPHF